MKFDFGSYIKYLNNKEFDNAEKFKEKSLPSKLYKYFSLSEESNNELDIKKLESLMNKSMWMSRYSNLNDPFELQALYLNEDKFKENGYAESDIDNIKTFFEMHKNMYLISCFTDEYTDNMPMWAHYSNNHRGFCLEVEIKNPKLVYPISYENDRVPVAKIITDLFQLIKKVESGEISEDNDDFKLFLNLWIHSTLIKHKSWEYENEYRIIMPSIGKKSNQGEIVSFNELEIIVKRIIIGYKCNKEHEEQLKVIGKKLNVPCSKIYINELNPKFELSLK